MRDLARSPKQLGSIIRRARRNAGLTQTQLGQKINMRQATISKLEAGEPGTRLTTLLDALAALDLELSVGQRTKGTRQQLADVF